MGAKQSKGGKVTDQNGTDANNEEGLDTFNKTSTLPATFRSKEDDVTKGGTLPRDGANIDRNTSFSKRFRKSVSRLMGVSEKDEKENGTSPQKEPSPVNGEASPTKETDERDSSVKSPVDHKLAQKIARAKFFQDLYTTPTNVPKPPRSLNVSVDTADGEDKSATPVVKLIEKHQEAIEKHQEEIRNSMSSPDILKDRLESFRKSKVIENGSLMKKEEFNETKTESSFTNRIENQEELITTQQSSSEQKTFEATSVACQESSSMKVESSQITETKSQHIAENLETRESITSSSVEQAATHIEATEKKMSVSESVVESSSECVQSSSETVMEAVSSATTMETVSSSAMESVSVAQSSVSQSVESSSQQMTSESVTESSSCVEETSVAESVSTTMESMSLQTESQAMETVTQSTFESMESHSSTEESHVVTEQKSSQQIETCESQVSESLVQTHTEETESSSAAQVEDQTAEDDSSDKQNVECNEGSDDEKPESKDSAHESDPESEPE